MRAPFQILALPYKMVDGVPYYCVFHRADHDQWQFVAGGGEDDETPLDAAKREIFEEIGIRTEQLFAFIDRTGKQDSEIYKKALIDRRLFSKIRSNKNYIPAKKTVSHNACHSPRGC